MSTRDCSVEGCDHTARARGLCAIHYKRLLRHGSTSVNKNPGRGKSLAQRMEMYTSKTEGCWAWTAHINQEGYGVIRGEAGAVHAHRIAYELAFGMIPDGLVIDHLCRTRRCVRPDHLEAVTIKENVLRGVGTGAGFSRRDRCGKGHEFTPENTAQRTDGGRRCRTCRREESRSRKARNRGIKAVAA